MRNTHPATADAQAWLHTCQQRSRLQVSAIAWDQCSAWQVSAECIAHASGGFFTVRALSCDAQANVTGAHAQPMIDQPEIGILGFLLRQSANGIEWLLQAKTEPGNVGGTQIAPSVQATESNYRQRHGGAPTPYLDAFLNPTPHQVLANVLGSEQGSRFIGKYNRNMSVLLDTDPGTPLGDNLAWYPSPVLRNLLLRDYLLNTDARSSLFSGDWHMLADDQPFGDPDSPFALSLLESYHSSDNDLSETITWLDNLRQSQAPVVHRLALAELLDWRTSDQALTRHPAGDFEVRPYAVHTLDREVEQWQQPLFSGKQTNLAILYCQKHDGVLRFLLRASWELGFREGFQLGPSWQSDAMATQPAELTHLQHDEHSEVLCQIRQSDEGGRFINSICSYQLRLLPEAQSLTPHAHYRWVTLAQIHAMRRVQGLLTNEARSLLSMLLAWV